MTDTSAQRAGLARGELRRELHFEGGVLIDQVVEMDSGKPRRKRVARAPVVPLSQRTSITAAEFQALTKGKR